MPSIIDVGEPFLARILAIRCPSEDNPIVQGASLFNQLLQHFPRTEFAALVKKHAAERAAKGFTCWTQFVAMLFCQPGHATGLCSLSASSIPWVAVHGPETRSSGRRGSIRCLVALRVPSVRAA